MIQQGSRVQIHYTLTVDGQTVDSSEGQDPLEYEHGSGQIIEGLEDQLEGKDVGHKGTIEVSPGKGYGEHDPDGIQVVPRDAFSEADGLEPGISVSGKDEEGNPFEATVTEITEDNVTLDFNHPLAGKTLSFDVEVVSVS